MRLYAVRDKNTNKLVSDITNPRHKFWERKGDCAKSINRYNNNKNWNITDYDLELVEFELVEVQKDENY